MLRPKGCVRPPADVWIQRAHTRRGPGWQLVLQNGLDLLDQLVRTHRATLERPLVASLVKLRQELLLPLGPQLVRLVVSAVNGLERLTTRLGTLDLILPAAVASTRGDGWAVSPRPLCARSTRFDWRPVTHSRLSNLHSSHSSRPWPQNAAPMASQSSRGSGVSPSTSRSDGRAVGPLPTATPRPCGIT